MGHKEHCCIGPIPFWWFLMPFHATCLLKFSFFRNCLSQRLKTYAIGFCTPSTLHRCHSSISMHFSQSKSTKCEIFAWNFYFPVTTYCRDSKPAPLDLPCLKPWICTTQTISMCFSQSKSTKCEIFGCLLNSPWPKKKK